MTIDLMWLFLSVALYCAVQVWLAAWQARRDRLPRPAQFEARLVRLEQLYRDLVDL